LFGDVWGTIGGRRLGGTRPKERLAWRPRRAQDNFRRREWGPAVTAFRVVRPARIYDRRATFASNALAAGVTVFELARVMGTSVWMIERHYGRLDGAHAGIAGRLDAIEAALEQAGMASHNEK
jgi:hypothetical protein